MVWLPSIRLFPQIRDEAKKVAIDKDLSQSSVRDIFNRWARQQQQPMGSGELTRVLGIDEISLKKRHQQFALVSLILREDAWWRC
jgi:hypothetical protein